MSLLKVNNIEVIYNDVILVLKGMSLEVKEGQIVSLLGANGAGKTTTLKAISGLLKTEEGEVTDGVIEFENEAIHRLDPEAIVRRGIFQVMEGRRVFEDLTVEENLIVAAHLQTGRKKIKELEELVYAYFPRIKERSKSPAGYLSGGEQQMLVIGRALMAQPKLMLLDEPSLGLSPLLVGEIFHIIKKINDEQQTTILLVEHDMSVVFSVSERIVVMHQGVVIADGKSEEIKQNEKVREAYLGEE